MNFLSRISLFIITILTCTSALALEVCDALDVGESKNIFIGRFENHAKMAPRYILRRVSETHHEVYFRMKFINKTNSKETSDELNKIFQAKAHSCAYKYRDSLVDPSGRSISLMMYDEDSHKQLLGGEPTLVSIAILPKGKRSYSGGYARNIECKEIVHELLHIAGLVDEYDEKDEDDKPLYPNRAVGPLTSWMADSSMTFFGMGAKKKFLYPGQLDAILYPNCLEKNSLYYSCAAQAYDGKPSGEILPSCKTKAGWLKGGLLSGLQVPPS
ncbi:MAG TPA: hypothetical protein VNJ01_05160 [Bacteriovoracaceae bacterium]|nr:hypothetical protein [Bacteriovoracaceae bacterium]